MSSDHKPRDVLLKQIADATELVKVGGTYAHYKSPDKTYTVLNIAITEADDELCVIYQADYDKDLIFVRPLNNWNEKVPHEAGIAQRFTLV